MINLKDRTEVVPPSAEVVEHGEKQSIVSRLRGRAAVLFALVAVLIGGGQAAAFAQTTPADTDPLNGGGDAIFTTLQTYLQTHLVTLVFGLAVVSIAVGLVLRWVKKAVHA